VALVSVVSSGILLWSKLPEDRAEIQPDKFGAFAGKVSKTNELKRGSFATHVYFYMIQIRLCTKPFFPLHCNKYLVFKT